MTAEEKILFEQRCRTCLLQQGQHNIFESSNCIRIELLYLTNLEVKLPFNVCFAKILNIICKYKSIHKFVLKKVFCE